MVGRSAYSLAALLSIAVNVTFWLAVIFGGLSCLVLGVGIAGALNGGSIQLPFGEALIHNIPVERLIASLISAIVFFGGMTLICHQVRRILLTLAAGDPFIPENASRLVRIALAIATIEGVRNLAILIVNIAMVATGRSTESLHFSPGALCAVIVLAILSQVFKEGSRLRESDKMTI